MGSTLARSIIGPSGIRGCRPPWWVVPLTLEVVSVGVVVVGLSASDAVGLPVASTAAALVTTALTVSAVVMLAEVLFSWAPRLPRRPWLPLPAVTAIVAAYLPNEQHHLCATLERLMALP